MEKIQPAKEMRIRISEEKLHELLQKYLKENWDTDTHLWVYYPLKEHYEARRHHEEDQDKVIYVLPLNFKINIREWLRGSYINPQSERVAQICVWEAIPYLNDVNKKLIEFGSEF